MSNSPAKPVKPPKPAKQEADNDANQTVFGDIAAAGSETSAAAADGEEAKFDIETHGTKNVAELLAMDSADESLRKYKESLLGGAAHGDLGNTNDPRRVVVEEFRIIFAPDEKTDDIVHLLSTPEGLNKLENEGITMTEGCQFKFRISFRVQHEIVAGVKFINNVSRMMVNDKEEIVIGSYPPSSVPHVFDFPKWGFSEAPKGMMFRGKYKVRNSFVDSDKVKHLEFEYELNVIKK
jgi:Rho GDP-dissociation inhibitor